MPKLSKTQTIILSHAAQSEGRIALPLPGTLRGGAAAKVVGAMPVKGFLEEVEADMHKGEPIWRETGDGYGVTLVATCAGLAAIGISPEDADTAPTRADTGPSADAPQNGVTQADSTPTERKPQKGTRQATLIAMLRAPDGATIDEIVTALDWQPHTVRVAMSGALKKKLGLTVTSEHHDTRGRVYRLTA